MKRVMFWVAFLPVAFILLALGLVTMLFVFLARSLAGMDCAYSQVLDNWENWCYETQTQWGKQTLKDAFLFGWESHHG